MQEHLFLCLVLQKCHPNKVEVLLDALDLQTDTTQKKQESFNRHEWTSVLHEQLTSKDTGIKIIGMGMRTGIILELGS